MEITNIIEVERFFSYLNSEHNLLVDPDCPFEDYVTPNGEPTFTSDKSQELEVLMDKCHEVAGDEVYTIAMNCNLNFIL